MRQRTLICVECNENQPAKGRICDTCRGKKRLQYHKDYYRANVDVYVNHSRKHKHERKDRTRAIKEYGAICHDCKWDKIPEVLEVHHLDCNHDNHVLTNLLILCPTCHMVRHFQSRTGPWASIHKLPNEQRHL